MIIMMIATASNKLLNWNYELLLFYLSNHVFSLFSMISLELCILLNCSSSASFFDVVLQRCSLDTSTRYSLPCVCSLSAHISVV